MDSARVSIIIPAHDEERTIGRCLSSLLDGAAAGEFEIVVACNGCRDRTADKAREFGDAVTVVEIGEASKVAALNRGDARATVFPRIYLDADVILSAEDARRVADLLREGPYRAAAPTMTMDLSGASWAVRAYYRVWRALPYTRAGMIGAGAYAVSEEGRSRYREFPDVISDDGWFRIRFRPEERTRVEDARSVVTAPARLSGLLRIKSRSRLGLYQLHERFPDLLANDDKSYGGALLLLLRTPSLWLSAPVYLTVNLLTRLRARRQRRHLSDYVWERDTSSRA